MPSRPPVVSPRRVLITIETVSTIPLEVLRKMRRVKFTTGETIAQPGGEFEPTQVQVNVVEGKRA